MKIKIIAFMMIVATLFMFTSCDVLQDKPDNEVSITNDDCRFEYLGVQERPYACEYFQYWRDTTTDVVYVFYRYGSGNGQCGGFTPLINADGTPVLWSEMETAK